MAQAVPPRDMRIMEECIATGEPVFVFRAKDVLSTDTLQCYLNLAEDNGCETEFLEAVDARIGHFKAWQEQHPDITKTPDLREGEY